MSPSALDGAGGGGWLASISSDGSHYWFFESSCDG